VVEERSSKPTSADAGETLDRSTVGRLEPAWAMAELDIQARRPRTTIRAIHDDGQHARTTNSLVRLERKPI
jgi:hypothetical protein